MEWSVLPRNWAPYTQSLFRIMTGLLFLEHGTAKLLSFPPGAAPPESFGMLLVTGLIELIGGALIAVGFLTRPVAFILSGYMAAAYFIAHAPRGFFPILNHGELAILYCFAFLYFAAAGAGAWAVDAALYGRQSGADKGRDALYRT
ncbi:MAG TPA: DoxX family protein [Roseiarcus sp.]|nr:DoxX family protein [Roseiarcus sp.]